MRWAAKVDANQPQIVADLRSLGFGVLDLHRVGGGVPDLLVSDGKRMWLMEIKTGKETLNEDQKKWWQNWRGKSPALIRSTEDALKTMGYYGRDWIPE